MSLARIETLRQRLLNLRRISTMPWWRSSYVEFLLERAAEYVAVGRVAECDGVLARADSWLLEQESKIRLSSPHPKQVTHKHFRLFSTESLQTVLDRLHQELITRRQMIPGPDRDALLVRLDRVAKQLQSGHLDEAHGELNAIRVSWIRRLTRSYRAWTTMQPARSGGQAWVRPQRKDLTPTGPYNSRRNLEEMVALVGERDPIWVEDFLEVFNDLLQYAERLSDPDKKKTRKG
jgi:hypothetical protein